MADEAQLKFLKECAAKGEAGIKEWNQWCEDNPDTQKDLSRANLTGADLIGANLVGALLTGAILFGADLSGADLTGAYLIGANLSKARLVSANLTMGNLSYTNLSNANLIRAELSEADFTGADLSNADLYLVCGLMVNSSRVVHTRFHPRASDPWSVLRRTYTGPNMVLNLLFVLLFFAPMIIKGAELAAIGNVQQRTVTALNSIPGFALKPACADPDNAIIGTARNVEVHVACHSEALWKLLLGIGSPYGFWMPILTVVLIFYQIARYLMTQQISLMRDAEERSGISPPKDGLFAYPKLYRVHQALSVIFFIGLVAFGLRAYEFLVKTEILLPG